MVGTRNVHGAGGGSVSGIGYVEGVRCVVSASNSAIKGGTVAPSGQRKGQRVQQIVMESGNPEGFSAEAWLQGWLAAPLPAFGNRRPWDVLQEPEGLAVIRVTLLQIQKGSFA